MRIKAALLSAALAATPLQAQESAATAADARAVITAILAHQASIRGPEGAAQTCVAAALAGPPAAAGADDDMVPDHSVRIYFQWHVPDAPAPLRAAPPPEPAGGGRRNRPRAGPAPPPPAPLGTAQAERLSALRAQAAQAYAAPVLAQVDAAIVPAPLYLQGPSDDCALITLSAPAFAGDAAFIEYAYACGTVCGNGGLYALQRREDRWELVGIADIWIR